MQYTDIGTTWRKLSLISGHARRDRGFQFTSLAHLLDAEFLGDCYQSLNRNKAVGIDGVSWKEYGENLTENLDRLVQKLKRKEKFLKAGYVDAGLLVTSEAGTPQGSILSPMLSNIFPHYVLDTWYETIVKSHVRGYCELVRYADDFICLVRYADDAKRIERGLHNRFNKYGLALHPAKTRRISFGRFERENAQRQSRRANTFDFLGFTHYCDTSRKGNFKVGRTTSRKKFTAKCREMNRWLKDIRNAVPTKDWWKILQAKIRGHYQYYGISENYAGVRRFYNATIRMVRKWMNRRSQKRKMSWEGFTEYLGHYPLPKPRIVHSFYASPAR
jgi:hypothetical protein